MPIFKIELAEGTESASSYEWINGSMVEVEVEPRPGDNIRVWSWSMTLTVEGVVKVGDATTLLCTLKPGIF